MTINHYTLNTGNMRESSSSEINKDIYFRLKSIINRAKRGKTELLDNTYIEISEDDYGYICDLYGRRGKEYVPILSTAGTKIESGRKYIWDSMETIAKAEYGKKYSYRVPVAVPYIVDLIHIPSVYFMEVMEWTGDFTRCLGWMLLFPEEVRRKI